MTQMFIDGSLAYAHHLGNLFESVLAMVVHQQDFPASGRLNPFQFFFQCLYLLLQLSRLLALLQFLVEKIKSFHPLLNFHVPDAVQASVSHACHQIRNCRIRLQVLSTFKNVGKDVVHNVLALGIIMEHDACQAVHFTVMLLEERCKLFSVRHTSIVHMKVDLLNHKWKLFYESTKKRLIRSGFPINPNRESCAALISKFNELWFHNKAKLHLFSLNEAKCPKYFLETVHDSFIKGRYFYNKKTTNKTAFVKWVIRFVD